MKKIFFGIILLVFLSCNKDIKDPTAQINAFGFTNIQEARENLGIYAGIFENTHGSVYIRSRQYDGDVSTANIFGRYFDDDGNRINGGDYIFDDIRLVFDSEKREYFPEEGKLTGQEAVDRISNFFGKENDFELIKDGVSVFKGKQYVPEKIMVALSSSEIYPRTNLTAVNRNDLSITWNADANNENGVVVYLSWGGSVVSVHPNDQNYSERIDRAVKLDDTGHGIIPANLFEGLPPTAYATLFIMRGNVNIVTHKNKSFRFYSISEQSKGIVLND
jgi:hypothetical protein